MTAVAVAPDGSWLASGSGDRRVRIWDVATGQARATLKGHTGPVTAVAVAPDGSWLASGSRDGTVRIWDAATGQARALMRVGPDACGQRHQRLRLGWHQRTCRPRPGRPLPVRLPRRHPLATAGH